MFVSIDMCTKLLLAAMAFNASPSLPRRCPIDAYDSLCSHLLRNRSEPDAAMTNHWIVVSGLIFGVPVVERERALHFAVAFGLNYRGFLGSCVPAHFALVEEHFEITDT